MKNKDSSLELTFNCAAAGIEKKADHLTIYDLRKVSSLADYFLIASGQSERQVRAIADHIVRTSREHTKFRPTVEGLDEGRWVLIDFGFIVVHLFHEEIRKFYDLDVLWAEAGASRVRIPEELFEESTRPSSSESVGIKEGRARSVNEKKSERHSQRELNPSESSSL